MFAIIAMVYYRGLCLRDIGILITKIEAINLLQNAGLTEKRRTRIKKKKDLVILKPKNKSFINIKDQFRKNIY